MRIEARKGLKNLGLVLIYGVWIFDFHLEEEKRSDLRRSFVSAGNA